MDVRKYDIYFECWPGYLTSQQSEEWDILFNTTYQLFNTRYPVQHISYFQASVWLCIALFIIIYKKLPHKNRAVDFNAFYNNQHMWNYHE